MSSPGQPSPPGAITGLSAWLPVVGFEGLYEVSDDGQVRSVDRYVTDRARLDGHPLRTKCYRGVLLHPHEKKGHLYVCLSNGSKRDYAVHRLVLEAFVGPCPLPPPGVLRMEACHRDGNAHDNRLENLRWGTSSSNHLDKVRHGTHPQSRKTECPQRHPYDLENTGWTRDGRQRWCRACNRERARRRAA